MLAFQDLNDTDPDGFGEYFSNVRKDPGYGEGERDRINWGNHDQSSVGSGLGVGGVSAIDASAGTPVIETAPHPNARGISVNAPSLADLPSLPSESSGVYDSSVGTQGTMGQPPQGSERGFLGSISEETSDGGWGNRSKLDSADYQRGGSVELQPLGPDIGYDESVYDGDSYHEPSLLESEAIEEKQDYIGPSEEPTPFEPDPTPFGEEKVGEAGEHLGIDPIEVIDVAEKYGVAEYGDNMLKYGYDITDHQAPALLDDLPELPPPRETFSWDSIDLNSLPPDIRSGIGEVLGDVGNASLGEAGIGTLASGWGAMGQFLQARGIDLGVGTVLMPFFNWIDDQTGSPWTSRVIQGSLAATGLIVGGDPFGAVALPIIWGIQEYMQQRQRLIANDNPEAELGRKFGYVREGKKWYPAIQTSKERDEGWLGSNKTQVRFQYGEKIKWKLKKGSTEWTPYFDEGAYKMKDFHVNDAEVDDPEKDAGREYQRMSDPLRDFYYLGEEETDKMLRDFAGGDTIANAERDHVFTPEEQAQIQETQKNAFGSFVSYDDESWSDYWDGRADSEDIAETIGLRKEQSAYIDNLQDLRSSLEFMQDYRYSDKGQLHTNDLGKNEFEGSRALRKYVNEAGLLGSQLNLGSAAIPANPIGLVAGIASDSDRSPGYRNVDKLRSASAEDLQAQGFKNFGKLAEQRYLIDAYGEARTQLGDLQKSAGTAMGFVERYANSGTDYKLVVDGVQRDYDFDPFKPSDDPRDLSIENYGWALYQDGSWEFGPLESSDQLQEAMRLIEESGDGKYLGSEHYRNSQQRAYLAQKAYTRYLYTKINNMGGLDYLHSESNQMRQTKAFRNSGKARNNTNWVITKFGLDPAYSRADDEGLPPGSYGTPLQHSEGYKPMHLGFETEVRLQQDHEAWLRGAGIIGDGEDDPDYVAGRFDDEAAWDKYWDLSKGIDTAWDPEGVVPDGIEPWDEVQNKYVVPGDQAPGTHYDPDTKSYVPDAPAQKPDVKPAVFDPASNWAPADQYQFDPDFDAPGDEPAEPKPKRPRPVQRPEPEVQPEVPEDKAPQVVPDEVHGASAPHENPVPPPFHNAYVSAPHDALEFEKDASAPAHIPLGIKVV